MSNSAIRGEDEAVLESIRRLVSATPHHEVREEREERPPRGKLLLTPSLRIEEPREPAPAAVEPGSAGAEAAWSLEDRIAELEAAVGARPDEWEPDGSEDAAQETPDRFVFQHRPLLLGGRDAVAEPVALRALPDEEPAEEEAEGVDLAEDVALPDEDLLRDMVAEIVRQELQGELGQKVTRNIRKLVRREIRRALASRDFD